MTARRVYNHSHTLRGVTETVCVDTMTESQSLVHAICPHCHTVAVPLCDCVQQPSHRGTQRGRLLALIPPRKCLKRADMGYHHTTKPLTECFFREPDFFGSRSVKQFLCHLLIKPRYIPRYIPRYMHIPCYIPRYIPPLERSLTLRRRSLRSRAQRCRR